jgi:anti-anti-sigma regulatory factor/predicted hydrocarbon binding protein
MKVSDIDFRKMLTFAPQDGRLMLGKDRLLIFREEAFGTLRTMLMEQLGDELARVYLSKFGYRCGEGDYKALKSMFTWDSEHDELGAGPVMHMWEGIVHVELAGLVFDRSKGEFFTGVTWKNSYEAETHLMSLGKSDEPVCHTLTGYASGYCSAFMGLPMVAIELQCMGKGDAVCTAEIRRSDAWGPEADRWKHALTADVSIWQELDNKSKELHRYQKTLSDLTTPIIQVWDGVVVVPVIGVVDSKRSAAMMEAVLARVTADAIRCVIFDVTGVEVVDTYTASHIFKLAAATRLLGASFILSGIRPEVARTLVQIGLELGSLTTCRSLKEGLEKSFELLGLSVVGARPSGIQGA